MLYQEERMKEKKLMKEINLVCGNHKLLVNLFPLIRYRSLYSIDDVLCYGQSLILDRAIHKKKASQVPKSPGLSFGTIEWSCPGIMKVKSENKPV